MDLRPVTQTVCDCTIRATPAVKRNRSSLALRQAVREQIVRFLETLAVVRGVRVQASDVFHPTAEDFTKLVVQLGNGNPGSYLSRC